jgi:pilus assembly protein CpaF
MSVLRRLAVPAGVEAGAALGPSRDSVDQIVHTVLRRLADEAAEGGAAFEGERLERALDAVLGEQPRAYTRAERDAILTAVRDEAGGYGPLDPLLRDGDVTEIMVNAPQEVYVERRGRIERTSVRFRDQAHVLQVVERILAPLGRRVDESSPMVDARLPSGARVNVIVPPVAVRGVAVTIRKFAPDAYRMVDLVQAGTLSAEMAAFLEAAVDSRLNVVVSGGTGSGKTTMLNALSSFIPADQRIVTIEDAAELHLQQDHVVSLEARPANAEGRGEVVIRQLVINALRMRPDRIIVGEVRGGEALDMLQAMNTGHDGSLTTAHANSPRDLLSRLETMVLLSGAELPLRAIRQQIVAAVDLIVHVRRGRDGRRRVESVTEVTGMEGETITTQDVFARTAASGRGEDAAGGGRFTPAPVPPRCLDRLEASGHRLRHLFMGGGASVLRP